MDNRQSRLNTWVCYPVVIALIVITIIVVWFCWFHPVTTVLIVRHAEKASTPSIDPPLSLAGEERAQTLVHVAGDAGVGAIYASEYIRTQQTVQLLATQLNLQVILVDAANVEGLVNQILSDNPGDAVLVVGHSNTIPQIIEKLGGGGGTSIAENEYDNLFVVTVFRYGGAKVVNLKYGNAS